MLLEGLGWLIASAIVLFAVGFSLDYVPVRFGYSELSVPVRVLLLALTGAWLSWIIFHFVLRRIFVPLKDSSIALLIERQYSDFSDSLVTTVNRTDPLHGRSIDDVPVDQDMLERTRLRAESLVEQVESQRIVNSKPAKKAVATAIVLTLALLGFVFAFPAASQLAAQRLYFLSPDPWPRECQIELVGLVVKRENSIAGIAEFENTVTLNDGKLKVARGSTVSMLVRAEASNDKAKKLPETCWLNFYRSNEGTRGSQPFKRIGSPRNGYQTYVLDGAPFENMISDLEFTIRGGDDRIGPYRVEVVDEPVVKTTDLACKYPGYIVDENSGRFTDRTQRWTGEARLPMGTDVTLEFVANKSIAKVYVDQQQNEKGINEDQQSAAPLKSFPVSGDSFSFTLPKLMSTQSLKFYLCDRDGIVSQTPHEMLIEPIKDVAPSVTTRLKGIGTAVTPDVIIPIAAKIEDDYGVETAWIELEIGATNVVEDGLDLSGAGKLETSIDFRQRRIDNGETFRLNDDGQSKLSVVVAAMDKFDLGDQPNLGTGERIDLDIVSPGEMLRILERLEVGQRRRLEQVAIELNEMKKYLDRTRDRKQLDGGIVEPGDEPEPDQGERPEDSETWDDEKIRQERELRRLFAQRALLQIEKSKLEISGSANAFDDLRMQLINNRIVGTNREQRFEEQIIGPLTQIADVTLNQLKAATVSLEKTLEEIELGESVGPGDPNSVATLEEQEIKKLEQRAAETTVDATNLAIRAIDELNEVLDLLIKFETQNELLDIVRQMIAEQKAIIERTKKQRQKQAFEGLLD